MVDFVYFFNIVTFHDIVVDIGIIGNIVDIVDIDHSIYQYCCINLK